jgi:peroxiredoxin
MIQLRVAVSSVGVILSFLGMAAVNSAYAAKVGANAPEFTAKDSHGKNHSLKENRGKYVVLEWSNKDCPYVKKHYDSGNMQKLQKEWTSKGVVWLTVLSSAPGKQGNLDGKAANENEKKQKAHPTAILLDPKGELGRLYGAKTTPHLFVINPEGKLIYNGAIDDKASTDQEDVKGASNYVSLALEEAKAGKEVSHPTSSPYGCSVKYE